MKNRKNEKYYAIRQVVRHYIKIYSENHKVYVWFIKNSDSIFHIDFNEVGFINKDKTEIYMTTLKNLYLYLFSLDYINIEQALLVYFANKELKLYTSYDIRLLLNVTTKQLQMFESGCTDFKKEFSFDSLSKKMGFDKEEFNQIFKKKFKRID